MTTEAPDGRVGPIDAIFRSLDDSSWGRRNLPRLVGLLSHDEVRVRVGAGWAITYVAAEHPDTAEYLVRRLGDRLSDDPPIAVEQALLGVAARYPDVAETVLEEVFESAEGHRFERSVGGMLRADYAMGGLRNRDVGRVRMPRGEAADVEGRVYTDADEDPWRDEDGEASGQEWAVDADDDSGNEEDAADDDSDDGADASDRPTGRPARELWAQTNTLAVIATNCRFDDLAVMAQRHSGRYADTYRTRADLEGEELAVALMLFHRPEGLGEGELAAYVEDLQNALAYWDRVDDAEAVLELYDWGREPRPWALVEYAEQDLWDRDRMFSDTALRNARHLATALSHAHENGVVHGGVDPGNVVYYGNVLDASEHQVPKLTNVGLLSVVRRYFDPTSKLDPRYAAPEYFDRDYGRIDHASDIYGLGAVCYHLFTGRPPYSGDYAAVRDAVLEESPPVPSAVADVPDGVDEIVSKAMATKKFHRYEGVTHMAADLREIAGEDADALLAMDDEQTAPASGGAATSAPGEDETGAASVDEGDDDADDEAAEGAADATDHTPEPAGDEGADGTVDDRADGTVDEETHGGTSGTESEDGAADDGQGDAPDDDPSVDRPKEGDSAAVPSSDDDRGTTDGGEDA